MSIRHSLLSILTQGPCYGYQLRTEFDKRTASTRPVNVGQIYNTLDRLVRDGLITKGPGSPEGDDDTSAQHAHYTVTEAGENESQRWLISPVDRYSVSRDELALKVAIAITLPGVDANGIIEHQRQATRNALDSLALRAAQRHEASSVGDFAQNLVFDAMQAHAQAELSWLDHVEKSLREARSEGRVSAFPLDPTKPKRGRPASTLQKEEARDS